VCIGVLTAATQVLSFRFPGQVLLLRKFLHVFAVLGCAIAISEYEETRILAFLFLLFSVLLFSAVRYRWLMVSRGESWGIALFPLAFGVLLLLPGLDKQHVVSAAMVLALADAMAGWAGSTLARRYWVPLSEQKSVLGSAVFFATTLSILLWRYGWSLDHWWPLALLALLATGAEMFSWRGSDNLTIPFVVALMLQQWQNGALTEMDSGYFLMGGLLLGPVLYWRRWLTSGGSNAAVWMGLLLSAQLGLQPRANA
jgi:dolichol kinase